MLKPLPLHLFFLFCFPTLTATAQPRPLAADSLSLHTSLEGVRLQSAVITGTRTPKPIADTPIRTRLITAEDIRKSDAANIQQLLQHELPGVEFSYALSQQIHLNFSGFGGQRVLFLLDGERLAGETMDNIDFSRITLADVERVEVVKGAASALYGSNAAGGVFNIITRNRRPQPWTMQLDLRRSAHNDRRLEWRHSLNRRRWTQSFHLHHTAHDTYSLNNPSDADLHGRYVLRQIRGGTTWSMGENFLYQPTDDISLTAKAGYFFRERLHDDGENHRHRDFSGRLKGEWNPSDGRHLEISYAFDQYDKSDFHLNTRLDIRDYSNVQHTFRTLYSHPSVHLLPTDRGATLSAGADLMRDYLQTYQFSDGQSRRQLGVDAFVQLDWTIDKHWEVVAAARYDHFAEGNHGQPTSKLSARYRNGSLTLRGGYGGGFRAPSLKERFMNFLLNDIFIIRGHQSLRPEVSHGFHLSGEWNRGNWLFETATAYHHVDQRITTTRPTDERDPHTHLPFVDYVNVPRLGIFNCEATAQGRWAWRNSSVTARLGYAFTHEQARENGTLTPYMPSRPHSLTGRIDYHRRHTSNYAYDLLLSGRFLSAIDGEEYNTLSHTSIPFRYPAYCLLRLSLQQHFGRGMHLHLSADNLLNYRPRVYHYNSPPTTGITLSVGFHLDLHELKP